MRLGLKMRIGAGIRAAAAAVYTVGMQLWHAMVATTWTGSDRMPDDSPVGTNTGALYTGRGLDFDGVNDEVTVGATGQTAKTIVFYAKPDSTTQKFLQLQASGAVEVGASSGTLSTTGWTSPTTYVDGAAGSTITTNWQAIAVTSATGVSVSSLKLGLSNATYYGGILANVKLFDIQLSGAQVLELYNNPEQILPTGASASNLVGWWPLADGDDAGIVLDGSGNDKNGTISGATESFALPSPVTQFAEVGHNAPMWFDNANDFINCGSDASLDVSSNYTVLAYIITDSLSGGFDNIIFSKGNTFISAQIGMVVYIVAGKLNMQRGNGTTHQIANSTGSGYNDNKLHCVAMVMDASNYKFYKDGVSDGVVSNTLAGTTGNGTAATIGSSKTTGSDLFDGGIFVVAVWNSNLSADEITEIHGGGINFDLTTDSGNYISSANLQGYWKNTGNTNADWVDISGNGNDGTVNGSPSTIYIPAGTTSGKDLLGVDLVNVNNGELILDKAGHAIVADDSTLDITDELTIEAWVKPFSVSSERTIIGKASAYALKILSSGKPAFSKYTSTTETETATTSTTLSADTWYHLAATYDGVNVRIYINGALDTTTAVSGAIDTNTNNLIIGGLTTSTELWDGYIDSVKIYSGTVLTGSQIQGNYNAEVDNYS